jgi:hypothetical protein
MDESNIREKIKEQTELLKEETELLRKQNERIEEMIVKLNEHKDSPKTKAS